MGTKEGWTPIEVAKSTWASTRLQDPYAITLEPGLYSTMQIKFHTLAQVIDMAVIADLGPSKSRNLMSQVDAWMFSLGLAPVNAIDRATKSLSKDHNLNILAGWFNGGNELPDPSVLQLIKELAQALQMHHMGLTTTESFARTYERDWVLLNKAEDFLSIAEGRSQPWRIQGDVF